MLVDLLFDDEPSTDNAVSVTGNVRFHPRLRAVSASARLA